MREQVRYVIVPEELKIEIVFRQRDDIIPKKQSKIQSHGKGLLQKSHLKTWQQRRGVPRTEAHKKAISQAHLNRNQTTPQARLKCLYCDVVASPANLATYHNDHCIHRPGYEAINQARLKALSGERMSRRNELIEGRRQ